MKRMIGYALCAIGGMVSMAFASLEIIPFKGADLPGGVSCRGSLVDGARWRDASGEHIVILCQTGSFKSPAGGREDERDAEVYAHRYARAGKSWRRAWTVRDFERNCPLDLYAAFLPGSLTVTDLDGNGIAEVTFLYRLACRGDVSPSRMKLIMYEGTRKYAVRGVTAMPPEFSFGQRGEMIPDPAFKKAPRAFLEYATARWKVFEIEKSFEQN